MMLKKVLNLYSAFNTHVNYPHDFVSDKLYTLLEELLFYMPTECCMFVHIRKHIWSLNLSLADPGGRAV
jgi:hypothetical protein